MCECILGWGSVAYHNWVTVTLNLTSDLISRTALCLVHISYILLDRISKLVSKCILRWRNFTHTISGLCDLDLWPSFKNFCVPSISLIFFEVGIPNLVCICIFGWWSLTYYFLATVTLTSDLVLIIILSGAYLLYYLRRESKIWCMNASWDGWVSCTIYRSLWPWPLT